MALAPARIMKTWPGSLGKHATFVAILSAPAADTNRWHSRANRSSAMDGGSTRRKAPQTSRGADSGERTGGHMGGGTRKEIQHGHFDVSTNATNGPFRARDVGTHCMHAKLCDKHRRHGRILVAQTAVWFEGLLTSWVLGDAE